METIADELSKTGTDETATEEVQASAEKKRKKKKSWSFRNLSFSKKDKSKPTIKEAAAVDVKTETVEEVRYNQIKNVNINCRYSFKRCQVLSVMVELVFMIIIVEDYFNPYN